MQSIDSPPHQSKILQRIDDFRHTPTYNFLSEQFKVVIYAIFSCLKALDKSTILLYVTLLGRFSTRSTFSVSNSLPSYMLLTRLILIYFGGLWPLSQATLFLKKVVKGNEKKHPNLAKAALIFTIATYYFSPSISKKLELLGGIYFGVKASLSLTTKEIKSYENGEEKFKMM